MMRPSLLRTFLAVASNRHITRAAAQLHLAQSSVSDQIQMLETELGQNLFIRSKAGLEMTPAGEALKPYAEEMLALLDEARAAVEMTAGPLKIGALETVASVKMPQWLSALRSTQPDVDFQLKVAGSGELLRMLENGDIDIVFCFGRDDLGGSFVRHVISAEPMILLAPPGEIQASTGMSLNVLAAKNFVATRVGCIYRHLFDKAFVEAGVARPHLAAEVDSIRTIIRLVEAGAGLALVPRFAVADALVEGKVVEISWPGPVPSALLVALWRRRRVQPPALSQLLVSAGAASGAVRPADALPRHAISSRS